MKQDISTFQDIQLLVDSFYTKVRSNGDIGPIFLGVIGDQWPEHLNKMYRFWQTLLLEKHSYSGHPFRPHASLPLSEKHFNTWMMLFKSTIHEHFEGQKADEAIERASKIASMFQSKIEYIRSQSPKHSYE